MISHGKAEKRHLAIMKEELRTQWKSNNLWVRRTFDLASTDFNKLYLKLRHDDNIQVYINGEKIYDVKGWTGKFIYVPITDIKSSKERPQCNGYSY